MAIALLVTGLVVVGTIGVVAIYRQVRFHVDMQESISALEETHQELQQRFSDALDRIEAVVVGQEAVQVESVEDSSHARRSESFQSLIERLDTEIVETLDMLPSHLRAVVFHLCGAQLRVVYRARGFQPDWLQPSLTDDWLSLRHDTPRRYWIKTDAWTQDVPQEEWQSIPSA